MGNPWIFEQIQAYLKNGTYERTVSNRERLQTILRHYEMMEKYKGERLAMLEMRKHAAWYLQGLPGSSKVKTEIFKTCDISHAKAIIREYLTSE